MNIDLQSALKFSDNFIKNRTQMRAYFRDVYPKEDLRTINLLLNVYEIGIPKMLLNGNVITQDQYASHIGKLEHEYGMTTDSAVEALNWWIDAFVSQGEGERLSKTFFKYRTNTLASVENVGAEQSKVSLGLNDTIYEDENIKIIFVKWERKYYMFGGNARAATFLYTNKTNHKIGVYMKDISVDGFTNQDKSMQKPVAARKKGMEQIPFVYEDKIPGKMSDFRTVEFVVCYGQVGEQYDHNFIGTIIESPEISLRL